MDDNWISAKNKEWNISILIYPKTSTSIRKANCKISGGQIKHFHLVWVYIPCTRNSIAEFRSFSCRGRQRGDVVPQRTSARVLQIFAPITGIQTWQYGLCHTIARKLTLFRAKSEWAERRILSNKQPVRVIGDLS